MGEAQAKEEQKKRITSSSTVPCLKGPSPSLTSLEPKISTESSKMSTNNFSNKIPQISSSASNSQELVHIPSSDEEDKNAFQDPTNLNPTLGTFFSSFCPSKD